MEFLSHYSTEDVKTVYQFMKEFNHYLEDRLKNYHNDIGKYETVTDQTEVLRSIGST